MTHRFFPAPAATGEEESLARQYMGLVLPPSTAASGKSTEALAPMSSRPFIVLRVCPAPVAIPCAKSV